MKMKVKIIKNASENIGAFEEVNKFPIFGSLFTVVQPLWTFDLKTPGEKIVEIIRAIYFSRLKETLTIKEVFNGTSKEYLVYQGSTLISNSESEYGSSENLQTLEEVDAHIKCWFSDQLTIEFPVKNLN